MRTAEYVSPMHPDKLCDRISDAILDECLRQDPSSRVAIETMGGHGIITITGEVTTTAYFNAREIARSIAGDQYGVQVNIVEQSKEIKDRVDGGGAGDQGIMVGYACDSRNFIPYELFLARDLCFFIYTRFAFDGKTQVTVGITGEITHVVVSWSHVTQKVLLDLVHEWIDLHGHNKDVKIFVNHGGDWSISGFEADTGVTGRKLAVDNYGPTVPIGGGAFSGKDPSKVDRSGAYKARQIALKMLRQCGCNEVLVKIAYCIGYEYPVMIIAEIDGEKKDILEEYREECSVNNIICDLELTKPIYLDLATNGHLGREALNWEL